MRSGFTSRVSRTNNLPSGIQGLVEQRHSQRINAQPSSGKWSPLSIANLWFDAKEGSSFGMSGAAIQTWTDKKYGLSLNKQNGGGFYTVNGQQFVNFLYGPRMYNTIGAGVLPEQDQQSTIAVVIGYSAYPSNGYVLVAGYGPSGGWHRGLIQSSTLQFGSSPTTDEGLRSGAYGSVANNFDFPHVLVATQFDNRFSGALNFRINGLDVMQLYSFTGSNFQKPQAGESSYVAIGADPSVSYGYGNFVCGDVIFCGKLDLADIQKLEGYLAHKWNATSRLDNNHPYKGKKP